MAKSALLLLPINNAPNLRGIIPGKMYEYLPLKRPILAIGPVDADFAKIIRETNSGVAIDFNDREGMKTALLNYYDLFCEDSLITNPNSIKKYSRKNLANKFMELISS